MGSAANTDERVFRIKITLKGVSKPPVWRRVLVPAGIRLDRFHETIQAVMGWLDYHMHVFSAEASDYGSEDPELGHTDDRRITLARVLEEPGDQLIYTYDFGDDWDHEVVLEQELPAEPGAFTLDVWPARALVRQRTAAELGDIRIFERCSQIQRPTATTRC